MTSRLASIVLLVLWFAIPSVHSARVVLVAGGGEKLDGALAAEAKIIRPFGVEFDQVGNLFFVEMVGGERVRKVDARGVLTTVAGTGEKGFGGDGGPATKAQFNGMHNLAIAPSGDIFVADTWNKRVRKIDARTGLISTVAGTGTKGFSGDGGPATEAQFGDIYCVSLDPSAENLFLADLDNRRIRSVNLRTGRVRTIAGNGQRGVPGDGAEAVEAPLVDPRAVTVSPDGNVYILERSGHALRVVDARGRIRTVAGTGEKGSSGDGGDARQATFNGPKHLCLDAEGNVIIADTENHAIRKFLPREGRIARVAGSGRKGPAGVGGPPEDVELSQPHGVYVHRDGTLYIADTENHRILKIER